MPDESVGKMQLVLADAWKIQCINHGYTLAVIKQVHKGANTGSSVCGFFSTFDSALKYVVEVDQTSEHDYVVEQDTTNPTKIEAFWRWGVNGPEKEPAITWTIGQAWSSAVLKKLFNND